MFLLLRHVQRGGGAMGVAQSGNLVPNGCCQKEILENATGWQM